MDLIRAILLKLEEAPDALPPHPFQVPGYDDATVGFHCHLMGEADLIEAANATAFGEGRRAIPVSVTWKGYEFLDAAREDTTWNKAKGVAASVGNSSFKILIDVLTQLALGQLKG